MKRIIAIIALAGASIVAHAQWSGQAQTVDSYTWGTPVPPKPPKHRHAPQSYANPQSQGPHIYVPVAGGAYDPQTGHFAPEVGGGYYDPQSARFIPAP